MKCFYATFIPGLRDFIAEVIKERLADAVIHKLLDGAVLFETETSYDKLNFFCFNNIFAAISVMEHPKSSNPLEAHIKALTLNKPGKAAFWETSGAKEIISYNNRKIYSFRVVISSENKPAAIDEKLRTDAEGYICRLSGLKVNRSRPDTEFWFLFRREDDPQEPDFSVFMKRLSLRPSWEKSLHKGELPPPLAWTLCRHARLGHGDVVLDPFCGYGSIPDTALKHFHITKFIACDNNREAALYTTARFKKLKNADFILHKSDFGELPSLVTEKSIDAIITDPPWGQYKQIRDGFHKKMFDVFGKLLKDGGRAVVLCANNDELLKVVSGSFNLQSTIPVLLSGKKAAIFVFEKK